MTKKSLMIAVIALLGLAVFAAFSSFAPVQAASISAQAVTPIVTTPLPGSGGEATAVVPNTGGTPDTTAPGFFISGWTLLIVLAVVIVVLLIALLARGTDHTV